MAVQDPFKPDCVEAFPTEELEPTPAALAAIEAEWPLIAAEVDLIDAECRLIANPADVLAVRARRRAVKTLLSLLVQQANNGGTASTAPAGRINHMNLGSAGTRSEAA